MLLSFLITSTALASAMEEVNHWRTQNGLEAFKEVPWMTKFAQEKAEWRAARLAENGHQGPRCPANCREGCGEARPEWGWLTCCQEETGKWAGAGVADWRRRTALHGADHSRHAWHRTERAPDWRTGCTTTHHRHFAYDT